MRPLETLRLRVYVLRYNIWTPNVTSQLFWTILLLKLRPIIVAWDHYTRQFCIWPCSCASSRYTIGLIRRRDLASKLENCMIFCSLAVSFWKWNGIAQSAYEVLNFLRHPVHEHTDATHGQTGVSCTCRMTFILPLWNIYRLQRLMCSVAYFYKFDLLTLHQT